MLKPPLILDFDGSVGPIERASRIPLSSCQEDIRFGCSFGKFEALEAVLAPHLHRGHGTVLMGSGDYHHLSYLLLKRMTTADPFQLVVFDNHPDNMRYPFGIHCGSWVYWASRLPFVSHVHVLGITSPDVSAAHLWENHLGPMFRGRLTYWCMGIDARFAGQIGLKRGFVVCKDPEDLFERFSEYANRHRSRAYLSVDKDVLSSDVAHTNWDQGRFSESHLLRTIALFKGRIVGSDITGEVSTYRYRTWWKRWLSALDGQEAQTAADIKLWQVQQHALNLRLLAQFDACG